MPRRGDNIRKRKDGRWEARYSLVDPHGQATKYGSVYGHTYQEAKEKRDRIIKEGPRLPSVADPSFSDVLLSWQSANQVRLKESSVSRYQILIDTHIIPELGHLQISQLTTPILNRFLSTKLNHGRLDGSGGLAASYVRSIALVISSAIKHGVSEGICAPLPTSITKPAQSKPEISVLNIDVQEKLEQELQHDITPDKLLIYITLYTGLRIGEACALRWDDIDLESKAIYVRQTVSRKWEINNGVKHSVLTIDTPKTKASLRCIPICSKLYTILKHFPYKRQHGFILATADNQFTSPRTFEYKYKKVLKSCGLCPVNYHCLRHTFATRCVEKGVDIKSLSEILGHANASITLNTYVHSSLEMKRIQLEKIAS